MEIPQAYDAGVLTGNTTTPHYPYPEVNRVEGKVSGISASDILQSTQDALTQRAVIRDQPNGERSAARAAAILTAWKGKEWVESDVWSCLIAVKLAREAQGAFHLDDYADLAGYSALLGEHVASLAD